MIYIPQRECALKNTILKSTTDGVSTFFAGLARIFEVVAFDRINCNLLLVALVTINKKM